MKTALFFLAFAVSAHTASAQFRSIGFTGWNEFNINFDTRSGTMKVGIIDNIRNGGQSGTLFLQAWLFTSRYSGGVMTGHKLYEVNLGQLRGGYRFTNLSYPISWSEDVPAGTYYVSFLLVEYNPQPGGEYWTMDYLNFDQPVTKRAQETRSEALRKLSDLLSRANHSHYINKDYYRTDILSQVLSGGRLKNELKTSYGNDTLSEEYAEIPWPAIESIDFIVSKGTGTADEVGVTLNRTIPLRFYRNRKLDASASGPTDMFFLYFRRSDRTEGIRLLNLLADTY